jgi:hypothetical protein
VAIKRLVVRIAYIDGRLGEYPITPVLQMGFERSYHVGIDRLGENNEGALNTYRLAFFVQGKHQADLPEGLLPTFDNWAETIEGVEVVTEDIGPFDPAASANGSLALPLPQGSLPASS